MIGTSGVGVLDHDLRRAAIQALDIDPEAARAYAERYSWHAATRQFLGNLRPIPPCTLAQSIREWSTARFLDDGDLVNHLPSELSRLLPSDRADLTPCSGPADEAAASLFGASASGGRGPYQLHLGTGSEAGLGPGGVSWPSLGASVLIAFLVVALFQIFKASRCRPSREVLVDLRGGVSKVVRLGHKQPLGGTP